MKRFLTLLLPFFILIACDKKDEDPDKGKTNPDDVIQITVPEVVVPEKVSTDGSTATFTSSVPWSISLGAVRSSVSWLSVHPMSGPAGKAELTIKAIEENPLHDDRSALITINAGNVSKVITITQKQKDAIIATKDKVEVDDDGGEFVVTVNSNITYEVVIPEESAKWIKQGSINVSRSAMTSTSEVFTASPGSENDKRTGIVIFKSGTLADTVNVYQAMRNVLLLTPDTINVSYVGEDALEVEIRSNIDYTVTIPSKVSSWVSLANPPQRQSVRTDRVYLKIETNNNQNERIAEIVFSDKNSGLSSMLKIVQGKSELAQNEFYVATPGTLGQVLPDFYEGVEVKIIGTLNSDDIYYIRDQMNTLHGLDLSEAEIVSGELPEKAFQQFLFATEFKFPKNISKIGDRAFYFTNLANTNVVLPETVTYIGKEAFAGTKCASFSANFPNVSYYDEGAFHGCQGFTGNLTITGQSTIVKRVAFSNTGFTGNLTIESNVEALEKEAFNGTNFTGTLIIKNGLKTIGDETFGWTGFSGSLTIPKSVESIGKKAFYLCKNFSGKLTIENGTVEDEAFYMSGFTNLELKEGVTSVGDAAFRYNKFEGNLVIPASVDKIETYAFANGNYSSLTIKNPQIEYENYYVFAECESLEAVSLPEGIEAISVGMFRYCRKLKSINFPTSLTEVGNEAFAWTALTSLSLPSSIEHIGNSAFAYTSINGHVTFPDNLKHLGDEAFRNCELSGYTLNNKLEWIGEYALTAYIQDVTVVIPQSVQYIGIHGLNAESYKVSWPVPISYTKKYAVYGDNYLYMLTQRQGRIVYVPSAYISAYQQDEEWKYHPLTGY